MKKSLISIAVLLTALVACNKEPAGDQIASAEDPSALIKVSLRAAGSMTKADPGSYEYGSGTENAVNNVRFYFFDANGGAYVVQNADNCIDITNLGFNEGTADNVEEISNVVLVIKQSKKQPPVKMVAIINAPATLGKNLSLSALQAIELDTYKTGDYFIMSNSAYVDGKIVMQATDITAENIFTATDEQLDDYGVGSTIPADQVGSLDIEPIKIYVERVAARVDVATAGKVEYFEVKSEDNSKTLYAQILGWHVTNNTEGSYLIKDIDQDYTGLGFSPWNNAAFYRSYWANTDAFTPIHGWTFNDIMGHTVASDYYFENTGAYADTNSPSGAAGYNKASQLIVAAQLTEDAEGTKPAQLGEMYGVYYTIDDLKAVMVSMISSKLYQAPVTGEDGNVTLTPISVSDVDFVQRAATEEDNRYEVIITPKKDVVYYKADGTAYDADEAKAYFDSVDPAKMWTSGYTYYYTTIQHFGKSYGMVRNHVYDITINSITGLGTPVYNPGLVITPEITDNVEALNLAAQINILSWHLVEQGVAL